MPLRSLHSIHFHRPAHVLLALLLLAAPAAAQAGGERPGEASLIGNLRVTLPEGFTAPALGNPPAPAGLKDVSTYASTRGDVIILVILGLADTPPNPSQEYRDAFVPGMMTGIQSAVKDRGGRVLGTDSLSTPEARGVVLRSYIPRERLASIFRTVVPRQGEMRVTALMVMKRTDDEADPEVRAVFDAVRIEPAGGAGAR